MRIHLQRKGWLAFQVTKQAQYKGQHVDSPEILQASAKKGMQSQYSGGKDNLVGTSFQWEYTDTSSDTKNSLVQYTSSPLKSTHQALMFSI